MGVGGDQTSVPCLICPTDSAPYLDAPSSRADSTFSHTVNVISLPRGIVNTEGSTGQTRPENGCRKTWQALIPSHLGFVREMLAVPQCAHAPLPSSALVKHSQSSSNTKLAHYQVGSGLAERELAYFILKHPLGPF